MAGCLRLSFVGKLRKEVSQRQRVAERRRARCVRSSESSHESYLHVTCYAMQWNSEFPVLGVLEASFYYYCSLHRPRLGSSWLASHTINNRKPSIQFFTTT
jgi:hypothetical protein